MNHATKSGMALALMLALLAGCAAPLALPGGPAAQAPTAAPSASPVPSATLAPSPRPAPSAAPSPTTALPTASPLPTAVLPTATQTLVPLAADEREQQFGQLWSLVSKRYLYPDYRGLDWAAVRAEYAPRVAQATDPAEFYDLLREMVDRLGDNHTRFETPQEVAEEAARSTGGLVYAGIGVTIRGDEGGVLITRLANNGPAEAAGLLPLDRILAINGTPITDTQAFGAEGPEGAVRGAPGTSLRLTVQSAGAQPREITLTRQVIPGDAFPPVVAQRLPGLRVGLLRIDTFDREDLATLVRDQLDELLAPGPLDGLIVDVRDNGGGYINALLDTLALFVDGGSIGSSASRRSREDLAIPAGQVAPGAERVPLAVLIDGGTASAAEMFAAGMRVRGRATLVGTTTAGNTENLVLHNFPDGSRLWLAEYAYRLPDDSLIEDVGVAPDHQVDAVWWRYAPADDPQVRAALEALGLARR